VKKLVAFSVLTLMLVAGIYQFVSAKGLVSSNSTQKPITAVSQTGNNPVKTPTINSTKCVMDQGMCTATTCDMSSCTMKFCDKQNGKCPPGQCKKCMP
jgi:hypothetical protein